MGGHVDPLFYLQHASMQFSSSDIHERNMSLLLSQIPSLRASGGPLHGSVPSSSRPSLGSGGIGAETDGTSYLTEPINWLSSPNNMLPSRSPGMPVSSIASAPTYSEDVQTGPILDVPDPLWVHKERVLQILVDSESLDKVRSRIRDLHEATGDIYYEQVLISAQRDQPDIAEAGQKAAFNRRKDKVNDPLFACLLCRNSLTTKDNLKSEFSCTSTRLSKHTETPRTDHYRSHLKWDNFQCKRCRSFFRTAATQKRHEKHAKKCISGHLTQ